MIICLAGFSGSGKSRLLEELREELRPGWVYEDLDKIISGHCDEGVTLGEYIRDKGWEHFRALERQCLLDVALRCKTNGQSLVLALGGGALEQCLDLIKSDGEIYLVGLNVTFETCWERIKNDSFNRPLVLEGKNALHSIYHRRHQLLEGSDLLLSEKELNSRLSLDYIIKQLSQIRR